MDRIPTFEEFLATQSAQISTFEFILDLLLASILAFILRSLYVRYGNAISNRKGFSWNFVLVAMTTMLVITIVKSSLALSLGLVGALSVIRFRTAIKEPEELSFLFLAIGIGLGLGANQRVITLVAFFIIAGAIWLMKRARQTEEDQNLYLTISSHNPKKVELEEVVRVLKEHCAAVSLKRFDDTNAVLEATFLVELLGYPQLVAAKSDLQALGDQVRVVFLDGRSLGGN